jgi:hypothetical protein
MTYLYINPKGYEVTRHSYSAGTDFNFCNKLYELKRIRGWQPREQWAGGKFGIAIEKAIRLYHESNLNLGAAIELFLKEWEGAKKEELSYSAAEKDWDSLNLSGPELLKLYSIKLPKLPILVDPIPLFQVLYRREVYQGNDFDAYVDMIAQMKGGGEILIDIKAIGKPMNAELVGLDPQLRRYSWTAENGNVGFLGLIKTNRGLEKGSLIYFLEKTAFYEPGDAAIVIKYQEYEPATEADPAKPRSKPKPEIPEEIWVVRDQETIKEMDATCGTGQKKEEKEARNFFIREHAIKVDRSVFTKQRIQFLTAKILPMDRQITGREVYREMQEIVAATEENFFPPTGAGIRFPNDKCVRCAMRGICSNNEKLRDELLIRKDDGDWQDFEEEWAA